MKITLEEIISKRNAAMKSGEKDAREAYNAVITAAQTLKASKSQKGKELTEKQLIKLIKVELTAFNEIKYKDASKQIAALEALLPEELPQVTNEYIEGIMNITIGWHSMKSPKDMMEKLDAAGYEGRYDKGFVAKTFMSWKKREKKRKK